MQIGMRVLNETHLDFLGPRTVGKVRDIYEQPLTPFVASFVGTSNLLDGVIRARAADTTEIAVAGTTLRLAGARGSAGDKVTLSVRPEALRLLSPGEAALIAN